MSRWRNALVVAAGFLAAGGATAQGLEVEPSPRGAACVRVSSAPLTYPRGMAALKRGGIVRVRLTFTSADAAPKAEVFFDTVGGECRAATLEHGDGYRLPCMKQGDAPVVVTQEFEFAPGDGRKVIWAPLRGERQRAVVRALACMTGTSKPPDYPPHSRTDGPLNGTVIARYTFTGPNEPPAVEVLFDGGSPRFAAVVRAYAGALRLPCLEAVDAPFEAVQSFSFVMEGSRRSALRDATLTAFLGSVDQLEKEHVRFDFGTMACPFEVRFELRQPVLPNSVGEVQRSDPNRREFLEWLRRLDLQIPARVRPQVIGDSMTIAVPCGVLDLS